MPDSADPTADTAAGAPAGAPARGPEATPGSTTRRPVMLGLPGVLSITAVDHVGVAVPDLEAAIAFHVDVLGLEVRHRETNEEQRIEEAMLAPRGAPAGRTQIQLLAPAGPDSPITRFLDRAGPGLQQLAYRVADVEAAAAALRARGLRVLYDRARTGTAGSRINFVHPADCGGVLVELVQPAGDASQPSLRPAAGPASQPAPQLASEG